LLDVRLTVTANRNLTTRFPTARLSTARPYQIGVYLPAEMTGTVTFDATIDDGNCVWGTGSAVATGVSGGDTTAAIPSSRPAPACRLAAPAPGAQVALAAAGARAA
jgi:hypothetical protein